MIGGSCPLCADATEKAFTKDGIAYLACRSCGFRWSRQAGNPNLTQRLDDFESAYVRYLDADPADRRNFDALLRRVTETQPKSWLDVGCGSGKLVRFLRSRGVEAEGIEPSEALFDHFLAAEAYFHRDLAAVAGRRFSIVSALDVLEHVDEPVAFLASLRDVADQDATIVVSTPDVASAVARLLGKRWHHYNRYHSSFFSPATLSRAAGQAGLRVASIAHPGKVRSLGYAARYLFEFGLRRDAPRFVHTLDRVQLPLNLGDVLLASLVLRDA